MAYAALPFKPGTETDDYSGYNQQNYTCRNEAVSLFTGPSPFMEYPTPHRTEDDDTGHVQRPAGKAKLTHLGLTHGIKEELHVPGCTSQRRKQIVPQHRSL